MNKKDLTVIMPALNEEKNIMAAVYNTLKAFEAFNINGEIIIVNDGSTDKTEDLVRSIINKDVRVRMLKHKTSQGIGVSFWKGVDSAHGAIVVMLPGDNENDPLEILRYIELLEHVDIVIPFIYNRWERPPFRNILSLVYRIIINTTFRVNFNYTNGTVLYRKSILQHIRHKSKGFFFQTEILIGLVKKGYLFAEVPYRLGLRNHGVSKAVSFPSLLQVMRGYLLLVKDIYFTPKIRLDRKGLSKDSLSARRYNAHP